MAIALTLKEYLDAHGIRYDIIEHQRTDSTLQTCEAAHIPGDLMAKSVLLGDDESYLMAVIPATHRLQLDRLKELTGRRLELIEEIELVEAFADCEPGAVPPIGKAYGIETLVDHHLLTQPDVYCETGDHTKLMHLSGKQFQRLAEETAEQDISKHL
jgi:Ala-tRNA(Pro) deacylase